jgi:ferrous iron transport protein B
VSDLRVALCGLPNTGKTTLFNALTGHRARVGNYPGITVERRSADIEVTPGRCAELLDIPGTYSLVARSADEQLAIEAAVGLGGHPRPDVLIACVDATAPARCLHLATQLLELGARVVVALTMVDEAEGGGPSPEALNEALGCRVVAVDARRGRGLPGLRRAVAAAADEPAPAAELSWKPSPALAARIAEVREILPTGWPDCDGMAVWALMSLEDGDELEHIPAGLRDRVRRHAGAARDIDEEVITGRYGWIDERIAALARPAPRRPWTERLDRALLHPFLGLLLFLALMVIMFQALFTWCDPAIALIEWAFAAAGDRLGTWIPEGFARGLVVDGLIGGVGSVLVFVPQILLLFFFLGLLEDLGYMSRVAVLMDRIMGAMNLHGRAFVPMLSGFACAIPAIMATRTMERRRDRLLTMMVIPLMTCSARLPVYTLIIAALIPPQSWLGFPIQGLLMVAMYLFSVTTALVAAWVLSRTIRPLRAKRLPLVVDLPPYRRPRIADVATMMWERTSVFVREAGTVILGCSVVLWLLLSYPGVQIEGSEIEVQSAQIEESYAGRVGKAIEPAIAPLGFDWKIGIGIVGAFAAREVFVSTMGVVYAVEADPDDSAQLRDQLRAERRPDGSPAYTPLIGLSLMIFFALACQCMSTLAVVKRETASWRWPLFLFAYMTALAWAMSFIVYQGGRLLGFG